MRRLMFILPVVFIAACTTPPADSDIAKNVSVRAFVPKARAIIAASLADPGPSTRMHAIEAAVNTRQTELMPAILKLLDDPSVPVRFAAATAIGDMLCYGCRQQAAKALADRDENVRIAAAYALAKTGDNSNVPLIRTAAAGADATVRANALMLLGKLGNRDDLELMYQAMRDSAAAEKVRFQAIESIAALGDNRIYRDKLWPLLISKYADDRVTGLQAMGALGSPEARNAIQTMLTDDVLEVRLAAAEQLARLGDRCGTDEVSAYFQTTPDLNRGTISNGMAVMAIGYLGSEKLAAHLPVALQSDSKYVQLAAAQSVLLASKP